ncbi:dihydrolipoamide acyltransferase component E2, putative [Hepatocystis sp. ex Piliocolobus tephrosceles]|nr:dihydrolipoamide acyltransferase component E2, putative [Hepatocystis sp. ex Piliocolobus tephrosceles]
MLCRYFLIFVFFFKFLIGTCNSNKYGYINLYSFCNYKNRRNKTKNKQYVLHAQVNITMPALSSTMTSGKIVKWNKNIGEYVNLGDIIMTVESDKADMDVEAFDEGYLRVKTFEDGSEAKVGDILGYLTTEEHEEINVETNNSNKTETEKVDDYKESTSTVLEVNKKEEVTTDIIKNESDEKYNLMEKNIYLPHIRTKLNKVKITKWLYKENDFVNKNDIILYFENDKSTVDLDSPYSGILKKILVKEGEDADLDKEVAIILESDKQEKKEKKIDSQVRELENINEDNIISYYKDVLNRTEEGRTFLKNLSAEDEKVLEERLKINFSKYGNIANDFFGTTVSEAVEEKRSVQKEPENYQIILPSAAELMKKNKLNPTDIKNLITPNRITYEDVENFLKNKNAPIVVKNKIEQHKVEHVEEQTGKLVELTNIQKVIKNNMMATLNIPVFRVTHLMKTGELIKLYQKIKDKVSMTAIINKCVATVLLKHPLLYSTYIDKDQGAIQYNVDVNIANALGLNDSLLTPVLKKTDKKDIYTLASEWRKLADKGKNGLLAASDMSGGNFYISNLGMFNTYQFDAILPKNVSCILSVGTNIINFESLEDFKIQKGMMMTLTCDHRHIYGSHVAKFMNDLSTFIEKDIMDIFL